MATLNTIPTWMLQVENKNIAYSFAVETHNNTTILIPSFAEDNKAYYEYLLLLEDDEDISNYNKIKIDKLFDEIYSSLLNFKNPRLALKIILTEILKAAEYIKEDLNCKNCMIKFIGYDDKRKKVYHLGLKKLGYNPVYRDDASYINF